MITLHLIPLLLTDGESLAIAFSCMSASVLLSGRVSEPPNRWHMVLLTKLLVLVPRLDF
jgi:hypothetical protein